MILIPSYQPTSTLRDLVVELRAARPAVEILVVDDGSGPDYLKVFRAAESAGALVIGYGGNRGKGAALREGFGWIQAHRPGATVVCADSDGQHRVADILRVDDAVGAPKTMVLGSRRFSGRVPARSMVGNVVTRQLFGLVAGVEMYDTQTGLRGYPYDLLDWLLTIPGDRFEYELSVLLVGAEAGLGITEIEIQTVYDPTSYSSHFRPLVDSWRVYRPLLAHGWARATHLRRPSGAAREVLTA